MKKRCSLETHRLAISFRKSLKDMEMEVKRLFEYAKERNTKREIKEAASKMRSLMSLVMSTTNQELLQKLGRITKEVAHETAEVEGSGQSNEVQSEQRRDKRQVAPVMKCVGTQTKEFGGLSKISDVNESDIKEVKKYEDYARLEYLNWPAKVFKNAFIAWGTPVKSNKDTDLVYLVEEGSNGKKNEGVRKAMVARFPEIEEVEGEVATISIRTRTEPREGVEICNERLIFKVETEDDPESLYSRLVRIREK